VESLGIGAGCEAFFPLPCHAGLACGLLAGNVQFFDLFLAAGCQQGR
jgi:hypothetical protein